MSTFRSEQLRQPISLSGSFTGSLQGTASLALNTIYTKLFTSTDFITASRDFVSTDANKILILPSGSNLTMPSTFPFNDGDIIGIYPLTSGSSFQTVYTGYYIYPYAFDENHQNELVTLTAISQSAVLAPIATALIDDVGFGKTALRHIMDTLPYKSYTALLTQTGANDIQSIYGGSLTVGVTYEITGIIVGKVDTFTILNPGTGYVDETSGTSGGNGSSLSFNITQTGGVIDSLTIVDPGAGYHVNDVVTITNGDGNATVRIDSILSDDFTNVGAPSNTNGIKFVAIGTTPTVWTNSSELSYNNGAPTTTILQNNIGNVWFTYQTDGTYQIESEGLFIGTVPTVTNIFGVIESSTTNYLTADKIDNSILRLVSSDFTYAATNGLFNNTPIEIRVYN